MRKRGPSHPPRQRAISQPAMLGDGDRSSASSQEARVPLSTRRNARGNARVEMLESTAETSGVRSKGMCGRAACPWASSNARSIENRAEASWQRIFGSPARHLDLRVGDTSSGSRQRKARWGGDLRLETGITKPLLGVRKESELSSSDTRGRAQPHDEANRRAGDRPRGASRVVSSCSP